MRKSSLIHAIWAIVAVGAFVVGGKRFAGEDASDAVDPGMRSGGRYAERSPGESGAGGRMPVSARDSRRGVSPGAGNERSRKTTLSESGIKSLGHLLRTTKDPVEHRIAFSRLLEGLTAENAMLIREQIVHMSSRTSEWREFHHAWGALAGQSSVEFGAQSEQRDMAACFGGWASANPAEARAWFESQPDAVRQRGDLSWSAAYGMAISDTNQATQFVLQRAQAGDQQTNNMIEMVANSVLRSEDIEGAARWSADLPKGELQDAAVRRVAGDYAQQDPEKALAWLQSLPQKNAQLRGMEGAFSGWASRDAQAAIGRIEGMQDSPLRDSAVIGFTKRSVYRDPGAAVQLASTISDTAARERALVRYGRIYMQRDREAATRWLADSRLAPRLQKSIRNSSRRR